MLSGTDLDTILSSPYEETTPGFGTINSTDEDNNTLILYARIVCKNVCFLFTYH
jgi:hypothetical protein